MSAHNWKTQVCCALDLSKDEKELYRYLGFLTLKPAMYIANVNEDGFEITRTSIRFVLSPRKKVLSLFRFVPLLRSRYRRAG
ncbi:hypothetical protein KIF59_04850 [Enterobacter cloacae subsp. cloacae]|nr:hypothetical protein [Enterobacter cloacae subsp. cloacae]